MAQQTLTEWNKSWRCTLTQEGQDVIIRETPAMAHGRTWLFDLSDYRVVQANGNGIIRLTPRKD